MKIVLNKIICLVLLCVVGAACNEFEYDHRTTIESFTIVPTKADTLITIERIDTIYKAASEMKFKWSKSITGNGTAVFYNVVFVGEGGSFSSPAYSLATNTLGTTDSLEVNHETLNIIAERCGVEAGKKGKIRWSVIAANGPNSLLAKNESSFEVHRPIGFADYPTSLFLMGSATSAGDDYSMALRAVRKAKGTFEVFAELGEGNYYFIDKIVGTQRKFAVDNFKLRFGAESESPNGGVNKKVYRFNLVFYKDQAQVISVDEVDWVVCNNPTGANPSKVNTKPMTYAGNCTWIIPSQEAKFDDGVAFAGSTAYKFKVKGTDLSDNNSVSSYFGSLSAASAWTATATANWYYLGESPDFSSVPSSSRFRLSTAVEGYKLNIGFSLLPGHPMTHSISFAE